MSRVPAGETFKIAPTNNVYTALAGAAVIIQILGLIVLYVRSDAVGGLF
jgi:hypothetical protein